MRQYQQAGRMPLGEFRCGYVSGLQRKTGKSGEGRREVRTYIPMNQHLKSYVRFQCQTKGIIKPNRIPVNNKFQALPVSSGRLEGKGIRVNTIAPAAKRKSTLQASIYP